MIVYPLVHNLVVKYRLRFTNSQGKAVISVQVVETMSKSEPRQLRMREVPKAFNPINEKETFSALLKKLLIKGEVLFVVMKRGFVSRDSHLYLNPACSNFFIC